MLINCLGSLFGSSNEKKIKKSKYIEIIGPKSKSTSMESLRERLQAESKYRDHKVMIRYQEIGEESI